MVKIEINNDAMKRASQRAMSKPLRVRMIAFREYEVINGEGKRYTVRFAVTKSGHKLAGCDCAGNRAGFVCYHIAGAQG